MMAFLCKIPHATIGSSWGVSYPEHQVPSMCPQPFVHTQFSLRPSHLFNGLTLKSDRTILLGEAGKSVRKCPIEHEPIVGRMNRSKDTLQSRLGPNQAR